MLSFTSSLSPDSEALVVFVTEKREFKDRKDVIPNSTIQKINSFLKEEKLKKKEQDINFFEISNKQKCFIIKVKNKFSSYWPQENGGNFFSYIKKFKDIKKIDFYPDGLSLDGNSLVSFFSQFIFGFNLKSYTFNKYKTLNKEKINQKISYKIITKNKKEIEKKYQYYNSVQEGVFLTRDLVSEPPNVLNPKVYTQQIHKLSKLGLKIKSYNEKN